jgi:nucleotide-binding universal stress UspA family protein
MRTSLPPRLRRNTARLPARRAGLNAGAVAARARGAGAPCETETAYSLSPGEAIIAAAHARQCDLIVMGSHGVRGLTADIAGSVTRHVLAYSAIPVVVLRPPRDDTPPMAGQGTF